MVYFPEMDMNIRFLIPLMLLLTGCSSSLPSLWSRNPQADAWREQLSHETALTPGAPACRMVPLGFAEQRRVRGMVIQVQSPNIRIKLDPGSDPILIDGTLRRADDLFSTPAAEWTPCL